MENKRNKSKKKKNVAYKKTVAGQRTEVNKNAVGPSQGPYSSTEAFVNRESVTCLRAGRRSLNADTTMNGVRRKRQRSAAVALVVLAAVTLFPRGGPAAAANGTATTPPPSPMTRPVPPPLTKTRPPTTLLPPRPPPTTPPTPRPRPVRPPKPPVPSSVSAPWNDGKPAVRVDVCALNACEAYVRMRDDLADAVRPIKEKLHGGNGGGDSGGGGDRSELLETRLQRLDRRLRSVEQPGEYFSFLPLTNSVAGFMDGR